MTGSDRPDTKRAAPIGPLGVATLLGGCAGTPSALHPAGPDAAAIAGLFWLFAAVCTAVWAVVLVALAWALLRRRWRKETLGEPVGDPLAVDPRQDRRARRIVAAAVAATAAILVVFTVFSYLAQNALSRPAGDAVVIRVTGKQWWWELRYEGAKASRTFTTANELHIPVGRPVRLILGSSDVIHSFWVPNLTGKMDLIPGRQNELAFSASRTGIYRGQCAEFCGVQHAHMGLDVIVESDEDFQAWRDRQIAAAEPPADPERRRGLAVFLSNPCVSCHAIGGTAAGSRAGPDLTHVGSRRSIAAGTLPMSRGNLAAWIVDAQGIKPGAKMPAIKLAPNDLNALVAYLEGLT